MKQTAVQRVKYVLHIRFFVVLFIVLSFLGISFLYPVNESFAATPTPKPKMSITPKITIPDDTDTSPSAIPSEVVNKLKQIESLKDKIATKVAQLRSQDKTAVSGTIKAIATDKKSLIITTKKEDKTVGFDEDMTVYKTTDDGKSESSITKLSEGDSISVFGYNNEDKSVISAKYIYVKQQYSHISGKIADIDKSNFTITIHSKSGNLVIDIESSTKMTAFSLESGKTKVGFSKLKIGDMAHIIATANATQKDRFSAMKLLLLPFTVPSSTPPTPLLDTPSPTQSSKTSSLSATPKAKGNTPTPKSSPTP